MKRSVMLLNLALEGGELQLRKYQGKWSVDYKALSPVGTSGYLETARGDRKEFARLETAFKEAESLLLASRSARKLEIVW